jgi:hypothetical protein
MKPIQQHAATVLRRHVIYYDILFFLKYSSMAAAAFFQPSAEISSSNYISTSFLPAIPGCVISSGDKIISIASLLSNFFAKISSLTGRPVL